MIGWLSVASLEGIAQDRTHKGFYLSMQIGPTFGQINGNTNIDYSLTVKGPAYGFDIVLGGTPMENLVVHGTIGYKSIYNPEIEDFNGSHTIDQAEFDEVMMGAGVTYYFKNNFLVSSTLGLGNFTLYDEIENSDVRTDVGFSYQVKVGKEWWISPRWALGGVLEYAGTRAGYSEWDYEETWQSHRFSVRFTATMHGRKGD